jgi:transcriptional regulator with XRE-family HTH domain
MAAWGVTVAKPSAKKRGAGRPPNLERRRRIAALRNQGLTLQQIGARVGISFQLVYWTLKQLGPGARPRLRCGECGREITSDPRLARQAAPALCSACLAETPAATFAQRLQALRLAAGLTRRELAKRSRVSRLTLRRYERGVREPKPDILAKLIGVLGVGLVSAPPTQGE